MFPQFPSSPPSPSPADSMNPTVVILADDLFFITRLMDVVTAQGGQPVVVENAAALVEAVDSQDPVLILLDLKTPGDWQAAIRSLKARPHTRQIPIYAFGSHVDVETLKLARQAGADHAWARSKMMEELVGLVGRHIAPPLRYPAGWDDVLSEQALAGVRAFNAGEYWEQHEHFEAAWLAETRPIREMYQGILQVGVAFLLIQRGKWAGAVKVFRRGLPRLRGLPDICQGLHIAPLRQEAEAIYREISALGSEGLDRFDQSRFPKIKMENAMSEE